jgi:hypothetical protein
MLFIFSDANIFLIKIEYHIFRILSIIFINFFNFSIRQKLFTNLLQAICAFSFPNSWKILRDMLQYFYRIYTK